MELREKVARQLCDDDGFNWEQLSNTRIGGKTLIDVYLETAEHVITVVREHDENDA